MILILAAVSRLFFTLPAVAAENQQEAPFKSGFQLYMEACANCHGPDGRGVSQSLVGFTLPLPDFTDCQFASREPDADWQAVVQSGGPARGFSELMPAFGHILSDEEAQRILTYIRTFCTDTQWPRGELNLPRPLITEKAFPEDEAVITTSIDTERAGAVTNKFVYEQRLGSRSQYEIVIPFGWREAQDGGEGSGWSSSLGDLSLGFKRSLYHSNARGSIFSATAEIVVPTGDEDRGFGKGTFVFEPFLTFGQILPSDFFLHSQAGLELPLESSKAEKEAFLRLVLGRGFSSGQWGRSWAPMVELLAARELEEGADIGWDIVPQIQVSLNRRQNVLLNLGVRLPLNESGTRDTQVIIYVLWDWFDGSLFEGW